MTTTARVDMVTALMAVLNAQKAATPTLLKRAWSARPGTFNELPLAFVGGRDEALTWDAGTRTRTFTGLTVTLVDSFTDNEQTSDRLDQLVDELVDRFNDAVTSPGRGSILELTSTSDFDLPVEMGGGQTTYYRAVLLSFGRAFRKEGRS